MISLSTVRVPTGNPRTFSYCWIYVFKVVPIIQRTWNWNVGPNLVFFPSVSIIFVWFERGGVLSVCEEDRGCFPEEPEM